MPPCRCEPGWITILPQAEPRQSPRRPSARFSSLAPCCAAFLHQCRKVRQVLPTSPRQPLTGHASRLIAARDKGYKRARRVVKLGRSPLDARSDGPSSRPESALPPPRPRRKRAGGEQDGRVVCPFGAPPCAALVGWRLRTCRVTGEGRISANAPNQGRFLPTTRQGFACSPGLASHRFGARDGTLSGKSGKGAPACLPRLARLFLACA